jgi:hypothetical protein
MARLSRENMRWKGSAKKTICFERSVVAIHIHHHSIVTNQYIASH